MGIHGFSQVFPSNDEVKDKDFAGKYVAIDAAMEIYRAALGMQSTHGLTDADGNPTGHINTILLGVILRLKAAGAEQFWIFDYMADESDKSDKSDVDVMHNPAKLLEIEKRREKRAKAKEQLQDIVRFSDEKKLFSDDDDDVPTLTTEKNTPVEEKKSTKKLIKRPSTLPPVTCDDLQRIAVQQAMELLEKKNKIEKAAFSMSQFYIDDVKTMLDCLDIPWIMAPAGFEAEQIAAILTQQYLTGVPCCASLGTVTGSVKTGTRGSSEEKAVTVPLMDYVLSSDMDALLFGAKTVIRRDTRKKKLFRYELEELLKTNDLTQLDLIKVGVALGCDFATKVPGIGVKTVLKKLHGIEFNEEQELAIALFQKPLMPCDVRSMVWHNINTAYNPSLPFSNMEKYTFLLTWLDSKGFNIERIEKAFGKLNNKAFS